MTDCFVCLGYVHCIVKIKLRSDNSHTYVLTVCLVYHDELCRVLAYPYRLCFEPFNFVSGIINFLFLEGAGTVYNYNHGLFKSGIIESCGGMHQMMFVAKGSSFHLRKILSYQGCIRIFSVPWHFRQIVCATSDNLINLSVGVDDFHDTTKRITVVLNSGKSFFFCVVN